jgi:hypothetical protein
LKPKNNLGKNHKRSSGIWELSFAKVVQFLHKNCSMDLK